MQVNWRGAALLDDADVIKNAGVIIAVHMKVVNEVVVQLPNGVGQWLVFVAINGGGNFHVWAKVVGFTILD